MTDIRLVSQNPHLAVGFLKAVDCRIRPADAELEQRIAALQSAVAAADYQLRYGKAKKDVRDLLRWGGFKPAGRNKPASEYIINRCLAGEFPVVNNLVDINNYLSAKTFLPMSIADMDKLQEPLVVREGREDESYVFNPSGQVMRLHGLPCVFHSPESRLVPFANGVKDAQNTKIQDHTRQVAVLVHATTCLYDRQALDGIMADWAHMLQRHADAVINEVRVLTGQEAG